MKYIVLQLIMLLMLIGNVVLAQNLIAVENGNDISFFTQLNEAVNYANEGDTIYIPGGTWGIGSLSINKTIHIIGSGHNPDSAEAGGYTYITGNINLLPNSSNGSICGFYLNGAFITSSYDSIVNYSIHRCRFTGDTWFGFYNGLIYESIIAGFTSGGQNNSYFNNIFYNPIAPSGLYNTFKNNLFLPSTSFGWAQPSYSLYENNIFLTNSNIMSLCQNSIFNNNLYIYPLHVFPDYNENLGSNNIFNQSQTSVLINQNGSTFNYSDDYHLQPGCPGINAGSDGTDIGIYGGMFPWKEGSLPPNPHIQYKQIQQSTDQNGNLNVNIKIAAQDH